MGRKKRRRFEAATDEYIAYQPDQVRLEELLLRIKPAAKVRLYTSYIFLLILLIFAKPHPLYFLIGTAFIMGGSLKRFMSAATIVKAAKDDSDTLIMTGPYSKSRHPLYFGSFLNGIGFIFLAGPLGQIWPATREIIVLSVPLGLFPWGLVPFLLMLVPTYLRMIHIEEEFLREKFGPLYEKYKGIVPCFFPKMAFTNKDKTWQYDAEKVKANREMRNFGWLMAVYVLFFAKMLYFLINDLFRLTVT